MMWMVDGGWCEDERAGHRERGIEGADAGPEHHCMRLFRRNLSCVHVASRAVPVPLSVLGSRPRLHSLRLHIKDEVVKGISPLSCLWI